jgi:O-antigen/teichoic acid export membrane protein
VVVLGLMQTTLTAVLTVAAAYFGMGAYSFVVPVPITTAVVVAANWRLARTRVGLRPEFSRWKYLFGNSAAVGGAKLLYVFTNQADYITLGLAGLSEATIGTYVFAFSVAIQSLRLLANNVSIVLFPGLSHLALDPERQVRAALRAMRLLALMVVPFCILQILLTEPVFRLLFPPRWLDAVLPCQILTLGLMFNAVIWPANSLIMAQGRYREWLQIASVGTIGLVLLLVGAVWIRNSIVSIAVAVSVWHFLNSPYLHWAATRRYAPASSYVNEIFRPIVAGVVAAIPCILVQKVLPETGVGDAIAVAVGMLIFTGPYVLLIYLLAPAALRDLNDQLAPLWARLIRSKGAPPVDAASGDGVIV